MRGASVRWNNGEESAERRMVSPEKTIRKSKNITSASASRIESLKIAKLKV